MTLWLKIRFVIVSKITLIINDKNILPLFIIFFNQIILKILISKWNLLFFLLNFLIMIS